MTTYVARAAIRALVILGTGVALVVPSSAVAAPAAPAASARGGAADGARVVKVRIVKQPRSTTVVAGRSARFVVKAKGTRLRYRWQSRLAGQRWASIAGATKRSYVRRASVADNGRLFRVKVTGKRGTKYSKTVRLSVRSAARITAGPSSTAVVSGQRATFTVSASGHSLRYQWQVRSHSGDRIWRDVTGGTGATLSFIGRVSLNANEYRVIVRNDLGSQTSSSAFLVVDSSRTDPYPAGTPVVMTKWGVAVLSTDADANAEILAENQFNDPPAPGRQYVMAEIFAMNLGSTYGDPFWDLGFWFLGNDNVTYDMPFVVLPNDLIDAGDVYPDGSVVGTVAAEVPIDAITNGVWIIEDQSAYPSNRQYFRLN